MYSWCLGLWSYLIRYSKKDYSNKIMYIITIVYMYIYWYYFDIIRSMLHLLYLYYAVVCDLILSLNSNVYAHILTFSFYYITIIFLNYNVYKMQVIFLQLIYYHIIQDFYLNVIMHNTSKNVLSHHRIMSSTLAVYSTEKPLALCNMDEIKVIT